MADRTPSGNSSEQSKRVFLEILSGGSPSSSSIISDPPLNGGVHSDSFGPQIQQHTSPMYLSTLSSLSSTNSLGKTSGNSESNSASSKFPSYLSYRGTHADTSNFNRPNTVSNSSTSSSTGVDSIQQLLQEAMKGRQTSSVAWKDAFSSESPSVPSTPTTSSSRKSPDTSKQEPESNDTATLLASLANALTTDARFSESTPALRSSFSAGSISKTPTSVPLFPMTLYPTEDNENTLSSKSPLLLEENRSGLANAFSSTSSGLSNTRFQESNNFGDNEKSTKYSYVSPFNVLDACINQQQPESSSPTSSILPIPELESTRYDEDSPMILLDTSPSTHHRVEDEEGGGESDIPSSPTSTPVPVSKGILKKKKKKAKKNRGDSQTQQSSAFNSSSPFEIHQKRDDTHVSSIKKRKGETGRGSGGNGGSDPDSDNGRQPSPSTHFASDASSTPLLLQENDLYLMSRQFPADTNSSPTPAVSYTLTSPSPTFSTTSHTKRRSTMTSVASTTSNQQLEQHLADNETSPGTALTNTPQKNKMKSFSEARNYTSNQQLGVDSSYPFPVQSDPSNAFAFHTMSVQQQHESLAQFHVSLDQLPCVEFKYLVSDVFRQSVRSQFLEASATAIAYLEGQHLVITLLTTQRTYHFDTSPHVTALVLHSNYLVLVHVESLSIYQLHPRDVRLLYGIQFHQANVNPVHVRHALVLSPHSLVVQCQAGERNEEYLLVLDLIHLESPTKDDEDHPILVGPDQPNCRHIEAPLTCLAAAGISNYFLACSENTVTLWHGLKPSRTFQVDAPISYVFRLTHTENFLNLLIGVNHNSEFWVVAVSRKSHVPSQILSQLDFPQAAFTISFDGSLLLLHHADEIVVVRMIETQWTSIYKVRCSETSVMGMALTSSHFLIALPSQIVECHLPSQSVFVNTLHPELCSPLHFTAQSMSANNTHSSLKASSLIAMKKHRASTASKVDEVPFSTMVASSMEITKRSSTNFSSPPSLSLIPPPPPLLPAPLLAPRPPSITPPVVASQGGGAKPSLDAEWIQYVDSKVAQLELNLERQIQEHTQKVTQALTSATQQWRQGTEETQQTLKQLSETLHPMNRPLSQPDMSQSMMDSLLPMLRKSIQTQFSKTLIPAYEKATQLMFQQLADMLSPLTLSSTAGEDATMESWNKALSHPPQLLVQLRSLENLQTSITSLPLSYQLRLLKALDLASDPSMAIHVLEALVPLLCPQVTKNSDIAPVLHLCLTQLEQLDRLASFDFQQRQSVWVLSHTIRSALK